MKFVVVTHFVLTKPVTCIPNFCKSQSMDFTMNIIVTFYDFCTAKIPQRKISIICGYGVFVTLFETAGLNYICISIVLSLPVWKTHRCMHTLHIYIHMAGRLENAHVWEPIRYIYMILTFWYAEETLIMAVQQKFLNSCTSSLIQ